MRSGLVSIVALSALVAACDRGGEGADTARATPTEASAYQPMCAAALNAAMEFSRRLRTSEVTDDLPVVLGAADPVRIRCRFRTRSGQPGEVTADLHCLAPFDRTCVQPVTATLDGRIVQGPGRVGPDRWP